MDLQGLFVCLCIYLFNKRSVLRIGSVGVLPIRVVKSNVSSVGPSTGRNSNSKKL